MPLRGLEKVTLAIAGIAGAALPPAALSGDVGRMLTTFLGLIAASILPTVSLLVNSMSASGRSVAEIRRLDAELRAAMDALFLIFGCAAVAVIGLTALAIETPAVLLRIPYVAELGILPRVGQAIVAIAATLIAIRAGQIPAILRRSLTVRTDIAIEEARKKLGERAPTSQTIRDSFPTHSDFGKVVKLADPQGK